jgi:hypothetical protein
MVHPMAHGQSGSSSSFWFNLDAKVGTGRENKLEDVEFVRLGYALMGQAAAGQPRITPRFRQAVAEMAPAGAFGPDLDLVIRAHEADRGGAQDGCVSPMPAQAVAMAVSYDGSHAYIAAVLNHYMRLANPDLFPRLDQYPDCGPSLRARIPQIFL